MKRALALEPRNPKVNDALAWLNMEAGRPAQAEQYLKTLVDISKDERSQYALSAFYVSVGRPDDALKTLEQVAKQPGQYATATIKIAVLYYANGRKGRAEQIIDEVLKKEPRSAAAMTVKARLLLAARKAPEALELIKTAIQIDPRSADALLTLARAQKELNDVEEARKALNDALKLNAHLLAAQLELSELHRNRNEIETAIQFAEDAIVSDPGNLAARLTLVRALMLRDQDHTRAEKELRTLLRRRRHRNRGHRFDAQAHERCAYQSRRVPRSASEGSQRPRTRRQGVQGAGSGGTRRRTAQSSPRYRRIQPVNLRTAGRAIYHAEAIARRQETVCANREAEAAVGSSGHDDGLDLLRRA
jgi:predicted Zn-dependent protease